MNSKKTNLEPNDPEFEKILRRVYEIDSPYERDETLDAIRRDEDIKKTYEGIKLIKAEMGFNTFDEYTEWIEHKKEAFHTAYKKFDSKQKKKTKRRLELIIYSTAAVIIGFIISFGIFQLTFSDRQMDRHEYQARIDTLKHDLFNLLHVLEENKNLLAKVSQKNDELVAVTEIIEAKDEKIKFLERNPTAINEIALYKKLAERKGYKDKEGLFTLPETEGIYAGSEDNLEVVLESPSNLDAYFIDEPLIFSWKTKLKGKAKLMCYVSQTLNYAFEMELNLENETFSRAMKNVNPGVYFWVLQKDGVFSERQYFVLLP
jgi:hypothetical protein